MVGIGGRNVLPGDGELSGQVGAGRGGGGRQLLAGPIGLRERGAVLGTRASCRLAAHALAGAHRRCVHSRLARLRCTPQQQRLNR